MERNKQFVMSVKARK